ncbi:hypothetical protein [Paraburkholderia youngii]|uniref:Uncharacterized protein n=1 Tax=Paraburkholderia youngii TaxID=2782701 RepID=A0A7Y6MY61_9BURK|nr:hypothetical protein [Paraburkholderia youngii]NUX98953.1 hypothetical protein [Paraburkholderia youngii]
MHGDRGIVHAGLSYWRKCAEFARMPVPDESPGHHFSPAMTALEAAADGAGVVANSPFSSLPHCAATLPMSTFPFV